MKLNRRRTARLGSHWLWLGVRRDISNIIRVYTQPSSIPERFHHVYVFQERMETNMNGTHCVWTARGALIWVLTSSGTMNSILSNTLRWVEAESGTCYIRYMTLLATLSNPPSISLCSIPRQHSRELNLENGARVKQTGS